MEEKQFLLVDKSGRGFTNTLDKSHIEKTWDLGEQDWSSEQTLGDFLESAEMGDVWETNSEKLTCL